MVRTGQSGPRRLIPNPQPHGGSNTMDVGNIIRMLIALAIIGAIVLYGSRLAGRVATKV